ncbi:Heme peroxidase [Mycena venus]|uniref:Heme peroxidase n=1 Tax=Mycena venus TaxID=2733690 RepID=A0A8H6Y911_9AGAR|nr:Heme peroxidase [Mycena venus]
MTSSELYHVKQSFVLGAYKTLIALPLPDSSSADYIPTLVYQARAHIALNDPAAALALIPADSENVAVKAVSALARYVSAAEGASQESALEELRDLAVEIEGEDVEGTDQDKLSVRVLAGTAFARAGEVEEALETLGAETEDLEAVAVIVQIYLSINRTDRAKREFDRAKQWAEDDLLLQLIESSIGLVAAKDGYSNANSFYTEQLGNPSLTSPHVLTARGVTRILRNEIPEAKSDLEESLEQQKGDAETLAAFVVAAGIESKKGEAEELWTRLQTEHPTHPLVVDVAQKADLFDEFAAKFTVPPLAVPAAAKPSVSGSSTSGQDTASTGSAPAASKDGRESAGNPTSSPSKVFKDLRDQVKKGTDTVHTSALSSIVDVIRHKDAIDDRTLALEHGITFISRLPEGSLATDLQNKTVELFYNDLAHPNSTNIGNCYAWRSADGSNNNVNVPEMGKAGTPYARSVQQTHPLPKHELPDAGLVFDTLLKRDGFVKHPAGLSSLMFSFAALVIHSIFRTSHANVEINDTSSYVDLSPLYGHDQTEQNRVRAKEGYGLLYPDVFAEDRLLLLPPAVCVILVCFSRNHNYIAKKIFEINERGTYQDPKKLSKDDLLAQDEELFQTARLVNCGWFGSVVFSDYFSSILGLVRDGSSWSLNPFGEIRAPDHSIVERGQGNVCSVEFNCLYRWHATTSMEDEKWVNRVFEQIFAGKKPEDVTPADFKAAASTLQSKQPDITHWTFGDMQRQDNGSFKDEDLANILHNATEHPAAAFRARGTPASMRLHEMMGIEQNRRWGVCGLNDFRKYLGLKPYANFREWNPDPEIADCAEKLYGDINNLELYVGLQAEEAKPVVEGAGLCPGYTISRAILSDAIALTRGDRHFTHDYTPFNLTAWGFADCQRDPKAFGFGSTLGRLFLRTLPNSFSENSAYAFFPLMTPSSMKGYLSKMHLLDSYDLSRPKQLQPVQTVQDYGQIIEIMKSTNFVAPYAARAAKVIKGKGFFLVEGEKEQRAIYVPLFESKESLDNIGNYFRDTTRKLISSHSFTLVGGKTCVVDIARDVLKVVPVCWAAEIAGIQLKTKENPQGDYTPLELYDILSEIYSFIFLETEKAKVMTLQAKVQAHVDGLLNHINANLGLVSRVISVVESVTSVFNKNKRNEQHEIVNRLRDMGHSSDIANIILSIMVGSTVELSLGLVNMVNLFVGSESQQAIQSLGTSGDLKGYALEAQRLDPPFRGVYRTMPRLFLDIGTANLNSGIFENPAVVDPSRHPKLGYLHPDGCFKYLGEAFSVKVMTEVLRVVFGYKNVVRAPGQSGCLKRFKDETRQDLRFAYLDEKKFATPWPTTMAVQYDAPVSS